MPSLEPRTTKSQTDLFLLLLLLLTFKHMKPTLGRGSRSQTYKGTLKTLDAISIIKSSTSSPGFKTICNKKYFY